MTSHTSVQVRRAAHRTKTVWVVELIQERTLVACWTFRSRRAARDLARALRVLAQGGGHERGRAP